MTYDSREAQRGLRDLPGDVPEAMTVLDAMTGSRGATDAWLRGDVQAKGSNPSAGRIEIAQAGTTMNDGGFTPTVPPSIPAPPRALMRGATLLTAAMLLNELRDAAEREQVQDALAKFHLNPSSATDVLAARAYVWGMVRLPYNYRYFWHGPQNAAEIERVAEAVMRFERDNPGTHSAAFDRNDERAWKAIDAVVQNAMTGVAPVGIEVYERTSAVDPALNASSRRARAAARITTGNQSWQAHHLIPFGIVARLPNPIQQAIAASGWRMDCPENVIALPANVPTYLGPLNTPRVPIHSGSHPVYDVNVTLALSGVVATALSVAPNVLEQEMFAVDGVLRRQLIVNIALYHPKLR